MEEAVIQYWVAYNHCVISLSARGGQREKKPSVKQCLGEIRSLRLDLAGWKRQGVLQRARKKWLNGRRQGGNRGFVPCTQPLWYVLIVEIRVLRVCLNSGNCGAQGDAPMWRRGTPTAVTDSVAYCQASRRGTHGCEPRNRTRHDRRLW